MRKTFIIILSLLLPLAWVWAAGEVAKDAVSPDQQETDWQPVYGEKGELLNYPPAVAPFGTKYNSERGGQPDINIITDILLFEDFETPAGWNGSNPPTGWTVIDSAQAPAPTWNTYDWYRYSYWGGYVARVSGASSSNANDDWLISPNADFTTATACTLSFRHRFDDYSTQTVDSGFVLLSDDSGATWAETLFVFEGVDYGSYSVPDTQVFDITAFAAGKSAISVAFQYSKKDFVYCGAWYVDEVVLNGNGVPIVSENFDGTWGTYGDVPPAGWTIIDNVIPDPWNNNDWSQYTHTTWGNIARVYYSPVENQNEWLITPTINLTAGYDQVLLTLKQYYNDGAGADTAWIFGSIDGGATWSQTLAMYNTDQGTSSAPDYASIDITSWANNQSNVKIAFKYVGNNDWYWYVDSLQVEGVTLATDDVLTEAINSPNIGITGYDHEVSIQVYNNGSNPATFEDSTEIIKINKVTYFYENFSNPQGWTGANPPLNTAGTWAVIDSGDGGDGWSNNDWHSYYYSSWTDTVARVYWTPIENQDEWLITPSLDFTGLSNLHLTFKQYYNDYTGTTDTGFVFGTTNNWATVETLAVYAGADYGSSSSPDRPDFDISAWADNQPSVQIAFNYLGNDDLYWYIDDVEVYATLAPTVDYISGETVTSLASLESREIVYANTWNSPTVGDYTLTTWTNLALDSDLSNDTMSTNITVYEHYESGGPDAGNYSWNSDKDGGTGDPYNWIDITAIGTPVTWDLGSLDNGYTSGIPLGFSFTFYDISYDRIYLSMNGFASFDSITSTSSYNYQLPSTSGPENLLALLWDDLSNESGGTAYYYTNNVDTFIVSYENWDFDIDLNQRIDMQMIITAGDRGIKYQYKEIGPIITLSHSIGIEDAAGAIGLQFVYNGNPTGNIAMSGLAVTFGYNPPAIDAALSSIDQPVDGSMIFNGTTVTPTVTVINNSDNDYAIPVTFVITDGTTGDTVYNQSETTALVAGGGGTLQYAFTTTWNANPDGNYNVEAFTSLAGDANPANDNKTSSFDVGTHYGTGGPDDFGYRWIDNSGMVLEDPPVFSYIDLSISPTADTVGDGSGNYGSFPIGFGFDYYGMTYDSVYINGYGMLQFGDFYSSSLNDCPVPNSSTPNMPIIAGFWDYGYCNATYDGACLMETFGVAPNRYTVIQFHNWRRSSYNMEWEIILYENGQIVMQYLDIDEVGSYGAGQSATVGIEDWDGNATGLGYLCSGDPSGNLLSDSLAIKWYKPVYAHDIAVEQFIAPGPSGIKNISFTPEVLFANNGINNETSVPVRLTINPGGYDDVQTIATLDSGTSVAQQFAVFTPVTSGSYTLVATSELVGDEDPASDTLVLSFMAYDDLIDFEADDGGLTGSGDWQWGAPNNPEGPANAYSGVNIWATDLSGDYTSGLHTLEFDLAVGTTNPGIGVASWYDTEARWDGGNFGVSTDGGSTWITVSPDIGYDDSTRSANPLDPDSIFTGHNQKYWDFVNFDLSAFAGSNIRARFAFGADGSVYYPGWHIDDLAFTDCQIAEGTIDGTVTDANTSGPLEGAIVEANGSIKDTTDVTGGYSFNIGPGEVEVVISKTGYNTNIDTVTVVNGQTTTHDVVLTAPISNIDTSPVVDNVAPGDTMLYSRTLYNTGTGDLDYSVSLNFNPGPMGIGGFEIRTNTAIEKVFNAGRLDSSNEYAPFSYNSGQLPVITNFMDSIFVAILDSSIENQFLGIEFDGEFFWATGAGSGTDPNKLYKLDANGNIIATYDQSGTTLWGWRDLAWDGQYLYASDDGIIDQIDPATGDTTGVTINGPATTNRALAYNPDTDHFFTANFSSTIDEFDRAGNVINSWPNSKSIYGMAFDGLTDGGPYLWIFSQDGIPSMEISQFEIATGTYTGVSWQGALPDGYIDGIAGGACFTTEWNPSIGALFVLGQGDPMDFIYGYEIAVNETWLSVASGGSGTVPAGDSAEIVFMVDFRDSTIVPDSTYEANANINNNSAGATPVIPFSITASAGSGGCDYATGDVNGSNSYNGLDITFGVAYFKGGADPMCPDCPPCSGWWYCGDVNGSCSYNGLDITFGVAYFKGGSSPVPCADCPPGGGPASIRKGNDSRPDEFKPITIPSYDSKSKKGKAVKR